MRFAQPWWLFGSLIALLVLALLLVGAWLMARARKRFGREALVEGLITAPAGARRALKGACLTLAVALAFLALAQPQYGKGSRVIPATDLDIVVVLDFSKSMYARDITPSRIDRAKAEVGRLIKSLPGARFAAVAFAGDPMSFPLTSDGAAIAQFFRQLSPNDMPVGGTAIARALQAGRDLLARDPVSAKHRRVLVLITDGEDLSGDPIAVARAAASDGVAIHVVQIGGRTPEPLPDVDATGDVVAWRAGPDGQPLTTSLSAEGEAQLAQIAEVTGGQVARSAAGTTGIERIARELGRMMREELTETVETVYADVYYYPLALALLLLLLETFLAEVGRRRIRPGASVALVVLLVSCVGCDDILDPLFRRYAPDVDEALVAFDAGDAQAASELLRNYLNTGECKDGRINTPADAGALPHAELDLGLGLFELAERFGERFGAEPSGSQPDPSNQRAAQRGEQIDCALAIVTALANSKHLEPKLRAKAHYLAGNLRFLRHEYSSAVESYDRTLGLVPGLAADAGETLGNDAAWNRAIALRRAKEHEPPDAGPPDAGPPDAGDEGDAGSPDAGDNGDAGPPDAGDEGDAGSDGGNADAAPPAEPPDAGSGQEQARDAGASQPPQPQQAPPEEATASPPSTASQDERILDELEDAPMLQEYDARRRRGRVGVEMEDK